MTLLRLTLRIGLLAASVLALAGCFRLDSFFYYDPTEVTSYQLDAYPNPGLADVNQWYPDSTTGFNFKQVSFPAADGTTLYAYLLQHSPGTPAATTILYCHGDAFNLDEYWPRTKLLYQTGADVLIFDYEGYGMSHGTPSEAHLHEDGIAAMSFLVETEHVPIQSIVLYGYSLGSVPAVWIAATYPTNRNQIKGMILEAPVGSAALFVQNATDLPIPPDTVTSLKIDNAELVKQVSIPYFWLQGNHDSTIRYDTHGQAVFDNYAGTMKHRVIVPGADHSDIPTVLQNVYGGSHYSVYRDLVTQFITNPAGQPTPP